MRPMRTGLLTAVVLSLLASTGLVAQTGPSLSGETGLFTLRNAEMLPQGQFSFGLAYDVRALTAAPSLVNPNAPDNPLRYSTGKIGMTIGYGLLSNWEGSLSFGQRYTWADDRLWAGVINGFDRNGAISHDETDKVRIGTKLLVNPNTDLVKFVVSGGMWIPTQSKNDPAALTTSRTDWDLGASFNYKILTVGVSWLLPAPKDDNYRPPNQINFGLGFNIPFVPGVFKGVAEINRVHFDGGSTKPDDYSEVALGGRVALGKSGFTTAFAARANIDRWAKYGTSPTPFGGLVQIAYSPQPVATSQAKAPVISSEPEPAPVSVAPVRQAQAPSADGSASSVPAPATTAAVPPAPRTETSTSDEILFDPAKARLTNIAKAILDGVALRLKNNLSATCTVVGYSDPKEKGDQGKLGTQRAEASRAYLMKRHGIDASRIRVEAGGASAASSDSTRNRRAVVSVTFP